MKHQRVLGLIVLGHVAAMVLSLTGILTHSATAWGATHETVEAAVEPGTLPATASKSDAPNSPAVKANKTAGLKTKKSTDVNFDDVLVQGKYHFSDEAVTTVEQDKVLDALLGVRTDFKDRLSKSAARH